jgi:hypothetical protein
MHNKETLPLLLKQLHLPCIYAQWEEVASQAVNRHVNWTTLPPN